MWNANLGLSSQTGYKQPPWELNLLPQPAVVIKDKEERDGCLLEERPLLRGLPSLPGAGSLWASCPVSRTFPESSDACQPGACLPHLRLAVNPEEIPRVCKGLGYCFVHLDKLRKDEDLSITLYRSLRDDTHFLY